MNFQEIASAYDSSGSESDEDPSGFVSTINSPGKGGEKGVVQADINQGKRVETEDTKNRHPESKRSSTPPTATLRLPPPPDALLGTIAASQKPPPRESEGLPQPIPKRRKIEARSEPLPARMLLPRQVQTKTPNVPTEDLQSYGISSPKTERKTR